MLPTRWQARGGSTRASAAASARQAGGRAACSLPAHLERRRRDGGAFSWRAPCSVPPTAFLKGTAGQAHARTHMSWPSEGPLRARWRALRRAGRPAQQRVDDWRATSRRDQHPPPALAGGLRGCTECCCCSPGSGVEGRWLRAQRRQAWRRSRSMRDTWRRGQQPGGAEPPHAHSLASGTRRRLRSAAHGVAGQSRPRRQSRQSVSPCSRVRIARGLPRVPQGCARYLLAGVLLRWRAGSVAASAAGGVGDWRSGRPRPTATRASRAPRELPREREGQMRQFNGKTNSSSPTTPLHSFS
jgi:hypothetical protein